MTRYLLMLVVLLVLGAGSWWIAENARTPENEVEAIPAITPPLASTEENPTTETVKEDQGKSYVDSEKLFHFFYPRDFRFIKAEHGELFFEREATDPPLTFRFSESKHPAKSIEQVFQEFLGIWKTKQGYNLILNENRPWKRGPEGSTVRTVLASWEQGGETIRTKLYLYPVNEMVLAFRFEAQHDTYLRINPYFSRIIDTLGLGEPTPTLLTPDLHSAPATPGKEGPENTQ